MIRTILLIFFHVCKIAFLLTSAWSLGHTVYVTYFARTSQSTSCTRRDSTKMKNGIGFLRFSLRFTDCRGSRWGKIDSPDITFERSFDASSSSVLRKRRHGDGLGSFEWPIRIPRIIPSDSSNLFRVKSLALGESFFRDGCYTRGMRLWSLLLSNRELWAFSGLNRLTDRVRVRWQRRTSFGRQLFLRYIR